MDALDRLSIYMDFYIQSLAKIRFKDNINERTKQRLVWWLPEFDTFNFNRNFSEHYHLREDGKLSVIHMGAGYFDDTAFMRREYSQINGIAFNFSEPLILPQNITEIKNFRIKNTAE